MSFAVHLGALDWSLVCSRGRCPGLQVRLSSTKVASVDAGLEVDFAFEEDLLD